MGLSEAEVKRAMLDLSRFLRLSAQFRLGGLPTEQTNPLTRGLAETARTEPARAVEKFRAADLDALRRCAEVAGEWRPLREAVQATLAAGDRVFLCGCGATGRLALNLELLWRESGRRPDRVIGLMAGGDAALVRSLEGFEDVPGFGARHLRDLGFGRNDLLLAITEGGETSYVIGAAQHAAAFSRRAPWFLFCNPPRVLRKTAERSRAVLDHPGIRKLYLPTGPMALAGSTRLQATTVQMAAAGWALFPECGDDPAALLRRLGDGWKRVSARALAELIRREHAACAAGRGVVYRTDVCALTVLTDTTERAPTFNVAPLDNRCDAAPARSWCRLLVPGAKTAGEAWKRIMGGRAPRVLGWRQPAHYRLRLSRRWINGFDFSETGLRGAEHWPVMTMRRAAAGLRLGLGRTGVVLPTAGRSALEEALLLKLALNTHSTLMMARLGRFDSNVMTWVRPSNLKLVDRAIRYVQSLSRPPVSYRAAAAAVFAEKLTLDEGTSLVQRAVRRLAAERTKGAKKTKNT